jgi:hypothetical protein
VGTMTTSRPPSVSPIERRKPHVCGALLGSGSDGTRTRDLRRDRGSEGRFNGVNDGVEPNVSRGRRMLSVVWAHSGHEPTPGRAPGCDASAAADGQRAAVALRLRGVVSGTAGAAGVSGSCACGCRWRALPRVPGAAGIPSSSAEPAAAVKGRRPDPERSERVDRPPSGVATAVPLSVRCATW